MIFFILILGKVRLNKGKYVYRVSIGAGEGPLGVKAIVEKMIHWLIHSCCITLNSFFYFAFLLLQIFVGSIRMFFTVVPHTI